MHASLKGGPIKSRVVRALFALVGLVVALGLLAGLLFVALPLAIAAVVIGGLATVLLPRLRRRRTPPSGELPRQPRKTARQPGEMQRVEPVAPPRTLDRSEET